MSKENEAQPRIFRAGLSDSELVVFLRDVAKKLETRELIIESPGRLRAKADAIEDELVRMKSDIDLFVVGYSDVTQKVNGYDDKSRKANGEELLLIAESAIKEMKKAASNKGLNISHQEVEVIRLMSTALGISRLMI